MKNWLPLVLGPALAMDKIPAPVCFNSGFISSSNFGLKFSVGKKKKNQQKLHKSKPIRKKGKNLQVTIQESIAKYIDKEYPEH